MSKKSHHPHGTILVASIFTLALSYRPQGASAAAVQLSDVEVVVKSQNTVGTRPDGSTVLIDINLQVEGSDLPALTGTGRHFGSGGTHAYWEVTGGVDGNILTLAGTVQDTNNPVYLGSPIQVIISTRFRARHVRVWTADRWTVRGGRLS